MAGTIAYAAPECLDPALGPLTVRADVYSLSCCLWELLAGRQPWSGRRAHEVGVGAVRTEAGGHPALQEGMQAAGAGGARRALSIVGLSLMPATGCATRSNPLPVAMHFEHANLSFPASSPDPLLCGAMWRAAAATCPVPQPGGHACGKPPLASCARQHSGGHCQRTPSSWRRAGVLWPEPTAGVQELHGGWWRCSLSSGCC